MESKHTPSSTRAANLRPKPLALPADAEASTKSKIEHFLQGMALFEKKQAAKAHDSVAPAYPSLPAGGQSMFIYELPMGLHYISSSLKIDDPPTLMRIGPLSTFFEKVDPLAGTKYWVGITWAEIFFPVSGERPRSVVGSKAYELVLKQPVQNCGKIVRENVFTTGRVVGVVITELPHETVSVRIEDWVWKSDWFNKGGWKRLNAGDQTIRARDEVRPDVAIPRTRGGED